MGNSSNTNATVIDCTFISNSAQNYSGGMSNAYDCNSLVVNCTFIDNSAFYHGGGAISSNTSNLTMVNCVFIGNSTGGSGGGTRSYRSNVKATNCIFIDNSAENGGGIYNYDNSNSNITNCTFSSNSALSGGGIYNDDSNLTVTNSILWDDTPDEIYESNSTSVILYSDVRGGWSGLGNIDIDPCFVEPGYWDPNGTPADANDDFWVDGDYHLKSEAGRWEPNLYRSSDFTGDGIANLIDLAEFANFWSVEDENLLTDLNRDGLVGMEDLCIFAEKYLTNGNGGGMVLDSVTSRCIDAGNPGSPLADEQENINNVRINMGAYGGTAEASIPPQDWALLGDLTNNGTVDFEDLAGQVKDWQSNSNEQPGDLNRDGIVDMADFALFGLDWLKQTTWH